MGVIDPVDAAPGRVVERHAVFDAIWPALGWLDPPRLEADPVAAGKIELVAIEAEQYLQFVIYLSHITSDQDERQPV
jgi:hypothetical protein